MYTILDVSIEDRFCCLRMDTALTLDVTITTLSPIQPLNKTAYLLLAKS